MNLTILILSLLPHELDHPYLIPLHIEVSKLGIFCFELAEPLSLKICSVDQGSSGRVVDITLRHKIFYVTTGDVFHPAVHLCTSFFWGIFEVSEFNLIAKASLRHSLSFRSCSKYSLLACLNTYPSPGVLSLTAW